MKPILMSFSPYWYYLIMEGIKTVEVRKTIPQATDWDRRIECYMTKDKKSFARIPQDKQEKYRAHFGKVGMRFRCDMSLSLDYTDSIKASEYGMHSIWDADIEKWIDWDIDATCIATTDLIEYIDGKGAHFLHISALKIYDTPKELGEFRRPCPFPAEDCDTICPYSINEDLPFGEISIGCNRTLTRPPQSWCYIEEKLC